MLVFITKAGAFVRIALNVLVGGVEERFQTAFDFEGREIKVTVCEIDRN